ncbi:hypothetical protein PLUA15_110044 [Pseudomonas lundensis]|uniref:Uncharacterized protein n=1 Tax=Pseudomonas lundensis TaxID=86185 RepID=A0AAX2H1W4_9PSED|nr:hypothetical protein PLUA15_110044 [Pseudomonas lundensis]
MRNPQNKYPRIRNSSLRNEPHCIRTEKAAADLSVSQDNLQPESRYVTPRRLTHVSWLGNPDFKFRRFCCLKAKHTPGSRS